MAEAAIQATGLTRRFGDFTAVDQLSLRVPRGSIYGFLGPNGSGKSTTIRMLTGLLLPSEGEIDVLGLSIPDQAEQLRLRMGYMTQKFSLYEDLSVKENLEFMAQIYSLSAKDGKRRTEELSTEFDLNRYSSQRVGSLSGGQRQRLALAAAIIHKPDLLFLDEPTSAVDPENRRDFWEKLFDLSSQGVTILVSTHYMDEAERCHRLAILDQGQVRADGRPEDLMASMGVTSLEVRADHQRALKAKLLQLEPVRSVAQLGIRLRVLVEENIEDPAAWLVQQLPELAEADVAVVRPNLEDVFVSATSDNGMANHSANDSHGGPE